MRTDAERVMFLARVVEDLSKTIIKMVPCIAEPHSSLYGGLAESAIKVARSEVDHYFKSLAAAAGDPDEGKADE